MHPLTVLLEAALWATVVWLTVVWACCAVYIAVSYIEALRHIPERSAAETLRSVLYECWTTAWTQPLMPIFQLTGRRLSFDAPGRPVVLVHGYFQNRVDFLYLARRLRAAGSGPVFACNFFWPQRFERSSVTVLRFVERVREKTGAEKVDLLTHSSGGLLALDLLHERPEWVGRVAVIAVPYRGVTWRGPVLGTSGTQLRSDSGYTASRPPVIEGGPVLSVYSVHDNLVHPASTSRLEGERVTNVEVANLGHLGILFDRGVADVVCEFLVPPADGPSSNSAAE